MPERYPVMQRIVRTSQLTVTNLLFYPTLRGIQSARQCKHHMQCNLYALKKEICTARQTRHVWRCAAMYAISKHNTATTTTTRTTAQQLEQQQWNSNNNNDNSIAPRMDAWDVTSSVTRETKSHATSQHTHTHTCTRTSIVCACHNR